MQSRHSAGEISIPHVLESGLTHQRRQPLLVRKARDRIRQVLIRTGNAGNPGADAGQDAVKVEAKHWSGHGPAYLGKVEDGEPASWLQHAMHLLQSSRIIGQVTEAEGHRDDVQGSVPEWKPQRIGLEEERWSPLVARFPS